MWRLREEVKQGMRTKIVKYGTNGKSNKTSVDHYGTMDSCEHYFFVLNMHGELIYVRFCG